MKRSALSRIRFILLIAAAAAFFPAPASAQTLKPGPQVLTIFSEVDDTDQPYAIYLPRDFSAKKKYPLVISLHGAGSNHRLNLRRVFGRSNQGEENDVEATRTFPAWDDVDFIVASPLARGTMGYQGVAEKDVYDVLADVKSRFPIDDDRVYLTGLSMGGGGTLWLGLSRPDIWAAIAPVCPAPPSDTGDLAINALNIPIHFFQGGDDPVVKPEGTREWVRKLKEFGTAVEYTEYPGVQHNSWEAAYRDGAIFKWFGKFRRNRFPDRVRFAASRYKYDRAYWVVLDRLTTGTPAAIDAEFIAPNALVVTTSGLEAFTLDLKNHPKFKAGRPFTVQVDGASFNGTAAEALSFFKRNGAWTAGKAALETGAKSKGLEGPLGEALAGRHIYVYGTAGNPSPDELRARRETAAKAADWSSGRGRLMVFPRTVADKDVRPSDLESSNLILFGTKETNLLIARFADRLPLELKTPAEGFGLVYIFPIDGHYAVISSGLPWWTPPPAPPAVVPSAVPAAPANPPVTVPAPANPPVRRMNFASGAALALNNFGDYILFKDSAATPVAEGRFDPDWKLAAADAEKLIASDVVQVKPEAVK
jgi:poly(3-hydroxybutyrate) depolymerase